MDLTFEWEEDKAEENIRKHKISFEEAKTVFNDRFSITISDPEHSSDGHRYIDIGYSSKGRIIVVVYTEREPNIRIISCQKPTTGERRIYEEYKF